VGDTPGQPDLGRRIPAVALPPDVWCAALALLSTLSQIWAVVLDCWKRRRPVTLQVTIGVPPSFGPLSTRVDVLAPALRLVEKPLDNTTSHAPSSTQQQGAPNVVALPKREQRRIKRD
jgi:hypothetical protein